MWHFDQIAEQRIQQAIGRGDFDDLEGRGKPLPPEDELEHVPRELRLAYRVLKNAGFVPEEIALRKEIAHVEALLRSVDDRGAEYGRAVRRLNLLRAKLGAHRGGEPPLHLEPRYYHKALERLSESSESR